MGTLGRLGNLTENHYEFSYFFRMLHSFIASGSMNLSPKLKRHWLPTWVSIWPGRFLVSISHVMAPVPQLSHRFWPHLLGRKRLRVPHVKSGRSHITRMKQLTKIAVTKKQKQSLLHCSQSSLQCQLHTLAEPFNAESRWCQSPEPLNFDSGWEGCEIRVYGTHVPTSLCRVIHQAWSFWDAPKTGIAYTIVLPKITENMKAHRICGAVFSFQTSGAGDWPWDWCITGKI